MPSFQPNTAKAQPHDAQLSYAAFSAYNNIPGSGRTGYWDIPPNNYDFYTEEEKYKPQVMPDGGILSHWEPQYNPTPEQEEIDRKRAYETGIPHGYVPKGDKYAGLDKVKLKVRSLLHDDEEYGGPFYVHVSTKMKVCELRGVIKDACGIMPGLQKLAYAGKNMEDSQRTLEHYGVKYWHEKFPEWPVTIRRW